MCCLIAKKAGGCHTIARVSNPVYSGEIGFIREELGLSMIINPQMAAAREIGRLLKYPSALKVDTFAKSSTFYSREGFLAAFYALDRRNGRACVYYGNSASVRQLQYASDVCRKPGIFGKQAGAESKKVSDDSLRNLRDNNPCGGCGPQNSRTAFF